MVSKCRSLGTSQTSLDASVQACTKRNIYIPTYAYNIGMIVNQEILISLGIVVGVYLLYKLLFNTSNANKVEDDYQRVYNEVLTSEEYKVKGQYDK